MTTTTVTSTKEVVKPDLVLEAYQSWRNHPVTSILVKNLQKKRDEFCKLLSHHSVVPGTDDSTYRRYGCELRMIDAILNMISEYKIFVANIDTTKTKIIE